MSTSTSPNRRERVHAAAATEIKTTARRLLVSGGPAAGSLRALARDMGMTASAIYHYYSNLDTLIEALCDDLFAELLRETEAARDAAPPDDPLARIGSMARAFRRWALANSSEFGLIFGPKLPGMTDQWTGYEHDAGAQFGIAFLAEFAALRRKHPVATPPVEILQARLEPQLGGYLAARDDELPTVYVLLTSWTKLYGMVAMEVFGHLRWALRDGEALFELELAKFAQELLGGR